jgi:hypothetical protein
VASEVEPVGGQQLLCALVVERRPLELEEQQAGLELRAALLHLLQQGAARRVGRVRREVQRRVRPRAADEVVDVGELLHRAHEPGPVELGDLPRVRLGERVGAPLGVFEQGVHPRGAVVGALDQRLEVPLDLQEFGIGELRCGHAAKLYVARSPSSMSAT